MANTEAISKLLSDSKREQKGLVDQRKTLNIKIEKLGKIIQECETALILFAKYDDIVTRGDDFASLIAEDNLRMMDAFERPEMKAIVRETISEMKQQAQNVAVDLLKRDEAMGVKERTVLELSTLLKEKGNFELAKQIEELAVNEKVVEKL